jgi:hypothetical protein
MRLVRFVQCLENEKKAISKPHLGFCARLRCRSLGSLASSTAARSGKFTA